LDGVTAAPGFPKALFPIAIENAKEIKDETIRQQLVNLMVKRSQGKETSPLLFVVTEPYLDES
jgi:hypothetical protein